MEKEEKKNKKTKTKKEKKTEIVTEKDNNPNYEKGKKVLLYALKVGSILLVLLPVLFIVSFLFRDGDFIELEKLTYSLKDFCNEVFNTNKFPLLEAPYVYLISAGTIVLVALSFFINKLDGVVKFVMGVFIFLGIVANIMMFNIETHLFAITVGFIVSYLTYLILISYIKKIPLKERLIITGVILLIMALGGFYYYKTSTFVREKPLIYIEDNKLVYHKTLNSKKIVLTDKAINDDDAGYSYDYIKLSEKYNKIYYLSKVKLNDDDDIIGTLNLFYKGKNKEVDTKVEEFYITDSGNLVVYRKEGKLYYWNGKEPVKVTDEFIDVELISEQQIAYIDDENKGYLYNVKKDDNELLSKEVRGIFKTENDSYYVTGEDEELEIYTLDKEKIDDKIDEFYIADNCILYTKINNKKTNLYVYKNKEISIVDRDIEGIYNADHDFNNIVYSKDDIYYVYSSESTNISYLGTTKEVESLTITDSGEYLYFLKNYHDEETEDEITRELVRYSLRDGKLLNRKRYSSEAISYMAHEDKCYYATDYNEDDYTASLYECGTGKILSTSVSAGTGYISAIVDENYILYISDYDYEDYTSLVYIYNGEEKVQLTNNYLSDNVSNEQFVALIDLDDDEDTQGDLIIYDVLNNKKETISDEASFVYSPYDDLEYYYYVGDLNDLSEGEIEDVGEEFNENYDYTEYLHEITYTDFIEMLQEEYTDAILMGRSSCSWCHKQAYQYAKLGNDYSYYYVYYLDVDKLTATESNHIQELTGYSGATPHSVIIEDGEVVQTKTGYMDYSESMDFLDYMY